MRYSTRPLIFGQVTPSFLRWFGVELSASNHRMLYVPSDFAHGYLTLRPDSEVFHRVIEFYSRDREQGLCFDAPAFAITWPFTPRLVSDKDRSHPSYSV